MREGGKGESAGESKPPGETDLAASIFQVVQDGKSKQLHKMTVDFGTWRIFVACNALSSVPLLLWSSVVSQCLGSIATQKAKRQARPEHRVRKPQQPPPTPMRESSVPKDVGCFFPLEGKAYTFGSRTEREKLSLTYFCSRTARLALSSLAA